MLTNIHTTDAICNTLGLVDRSDEGNLGEDLDYTEQ